MSFYPFLIYMQILSSLHAEVLQNLMQGICTKQNGLEGDLKVAVSELLCVQ